jgi:hypothetical protein
MSDDDYPLNEADFRGMAGFLIELGFLNKRFDSRWQYRREGKFLKSLAYVRLSGTAPKPTVANAARDAGIPDGTVRSWLSRDKQLNKVVYEMLGPSEVTEEERAALEADEGWEAKLTPAEKECLNKALGRDRINDAWERQARGEDVDWDFLDELPNATIRELDAVLEALAAMNAPQGVEIVQQPAEAHSG